MTRPTFCTEFYRNVAGRAPRGRGAWAFCDEDKACDGDYIDHTVFSPGNMTLSQAKRWAVEQPRLQGVARIAVLP